MARILTPEQKIAGKQATYARKKARMEAGGQGIYEVGGRTYSADRQGGTEGDLISGSTSGKAIQPLKNVAVVSTKQGIDLANKIGRDIQTKVDSLAPTPSTDTTDKTPEDEATKALKTELGLTDTSVEEDLLKLNTDKISLADNNAEKAKIAKLAEDKQKLLDETKQENVSNEAALKNLGLTSGFSRYSGDSFKSLYTATVNAGNKKLLEYDRKYTDAIAEAKRLFDRGQLVDANSKLKEIIKIKEDSAKEIQKQSDELAKINEKKQARNDEINRDIAVGTLLKQGVTDPTEILNQLQTQGFAGTAKEVSDSLKNLSGTANFDKLSGDIRDFFILKQTPSGLPESITSLPEEQQMFAFVRMKNNAERKATGGEPPKTPRISRAEADKYGFPPSIIGMNEDEVFKSLDIPEPPKWFVDYTLQQSGDVVSPQVVKDIWSEFRQEVQSQFRPKDQNPNRTKALEYFKGTYGDAIDEDTAGVLADRVALYVKGGLSYSKAVEKVVSEAQ